MKNTNILFAISTGLIIIGAFMKIMHYNHASTITLIACLLGGISFVLLFLAKKNKTA